MKKNKPTLTQQIQPAVRFVKKYKKFLFSMIVLAMLGFLVFRINQLATAEPSEAMIDEKLQTVTRPKLDQEVIDRIQQLQDQNVEVQSLFDQARKNPFNE
jgi:predicted negative regulator of RcsB-dependent stress response